MIYILHGTDSTTTYDQLQKIKQQHNVTSSTEVDITDITPTILTTYLNQKEMFSGITCVILNISGLGRSKVDDFIDTISKIPTNTVLIIYSNKELTTANVFIKNASKLKAKVFKNMQKITANVFNFVDSVFIKDRNNSYQQLKELLTTGEEPLYIFSMLIYGLRNIATVKFNSPGFNKMALFVKSKAMQQAKKFSEPTILELFEIFYKLDKQAKLGLIGMDTLPVIAIEKILHT